MGENPEKNTESSAEETTDKRPEIRADFIKRLFAVAVSVGFATTLAHMRWVTSGDLPSVDEWKQLAILLTGMIATVLSWDGYLVSIAAKPLKGTWRFYIDILLVFTYMFFLISSTTHKFWLTTIAFIFVLYVIWDFLSIKEYPTEYSVSKKGEKNKLVRVIFDIYRKGLLDDPGTKRGPIITLSWAAYFIALAALNSRNTQAQAFVMVGFAVVGLCLYRRDKRLAHENNPNNQWHRLIYIVALLVMATLYGCIWPASS